MKNIFKHIAINALVAVPALVGVRAFWYRFHRYEVIFLLMAVVYGVTPAILSAKLSTMSLSVYRLIQSLSNPLPLPNGTLI